MSKLSKNVGKKMKFLIVLIILTAIGLFAFKYLSPRFLSQEELSGSKSIEAPQNEETILLEESNVSIEEALKEAKIGDSAEFYNKPFNPSEGFADLVEYASKPVVNISAIKIVKSNGQDPLEGMDPAFKELFRQMLPNQTQIPQNQRFVSLGSGFVVRSDGFIVTNYHVIQDSENIQVNFSDGKKYGAIIYAVDPTTDIALLKIEGKDLPTLKFGDSDVVRAGDWVIAIGNPFGLGGTVSSGIISAIGRDINIGAYNDFIQTDAAINKGNSGGPMINTQGEVIGINTAIFSTSGGGSIGIGFSVPSNTIASVIAQLITNKKVVRGWLGVQIQSIDDAIAKTLGLPNTEGALVANVVDDGPAHRAGLQSGDIILKVNGLPIKNSRTLPKIISNIAPNTEIILEVMSGKIKKNIDVTVGAVPESENTSADGGNKTEGPASLPKVKEKTYEELGLKVAEINDTVRKYFSLEATNEGLMVVAVKIGSVAQQKGLTSGFKIISVNQEHVSNLKQLDTLISKYSKDGLLFLIEDLNKGRYFLSITKKELEQGFAD